MAFQEPPSYKFNNSLGFPQGHDALQDEFISTAASKPLRYGDGHAFKRMPGNGFSPNEEVDMGKIPNFDGKVFPKSWTPVETTVTPSPRGDMITKAVMRGPYDKTSDVSMPITRGGTVKAAWRNDKRDNRAGRGVSIHNAHYPEEYLEGHAPSRILNPKDKVTYHTDALKAKILAEHGAAARRAKMGLKASRMPNMVDFKLLFALLNR